MARGDACHSVAARFKERCTGSLVQQRQTGAVIVLAADASWIERNVANELSQVVKRITGALLPMVLIYWVVITGHASRRGCGTCSSTRRQADRARGVGGSCIPQRAVAAAATSACVHKAHDPAY